MTVNAIKAGLVNVVQGSLLPASKKRLRGLGVLGFSGLGVLGVLGFKVYGFWGLGV